MTEQYADYDSPWKEILERYFQEFMEFFFPEAFREINWDVDYEFLDKELQQVVRDAKLGRRLMDKLVSVCRKDGEEVWVLVHIEVQGRYEQAFARRMYVYNYRIYDRYERRVASLAVLADDQPGWRPSKYAYELFGCKVSLEFPVVKLLDYASREQELAESSSPFAIVVLSYLKSRETKRHPKDRLQWKLRLFKMLYEKGFSREDILELARFLDWIMVLPDDLEHRFEKAMVQFEEEEQMKYITSFERIATKRGIEEGLQQGLQQGLQAGRQVGLQEGFLKKSCEAVVKILETRFEMVPFATVKTLNEITDLAFLDDLLTKAVTVGSLDEFQKLLEERKE